MTMAMNGLFSWPIAEKFLFIKTKYSSYRNGKESICHIRQVGFLPPWKVTL